jgi:hypothetical protein
MQGDKNVELRMLFLDRRKAGCHGKVFAKTTRAFNQHRQTDEVTILNSGKVMGIFYCSV